MFPCTHTHSHTHWYQCSLLIRHLIKLSLTSFYWNKERRCILSYEGVIFFPNQLTCLSQRKKKNKMNQTFFDRCSFPSVWHHWLTDGAQVGDGLETKRNTKVVKETKTCKPKCLFKNFKKLLPFLKCYKQAGSSIKLTPSVWAAAGCCPEEDPWDEMSVHVHESTVEETGVYYK